MGMPAIPATQEAEAVGLQIRGQPQKLSKTLSRDKIRKGTQWQGTPGSILSSEKNVWHVLWVAPQLAAIEHIGSTNPQDYPFEEIKLRTLPPTKIYCT